MNNKVIIIPTAKGNFGIVISEINDSPNDIKNETIKIIIIHFISTFSFLIFSFFFVTSIKFSNSEKLSGLLFFPFFTAFFPSLETISFQEYSSSIFSFL